MQPGLAWAILAALLWGISPIMIDVAMRELDSLGVNAWRNLGGLIVILPAALVTGSLAVPLRPLVLIVASGIVSQGIGLVTYSESIHRAGPARAVPISFTYIFWAQLLGLVLFGEPVGVGTVAGAAVAVAGVWLVASRSGRVDRKRGVAFAIATSVLWALGDSLARGALFEVSPLSTTSWRMVTLTPAFFLASARGDRLKASPKAIFIAALSGAVGLSLALVVYYKAMSEVGLALATIPTSLSPVVSQWLSRLLLSERLGLREALGGVLVALGIALASF